MFSIPKHFTPTMNEYRFGGLWRVFTVGPNLVLALNFSIPSQRVKDTSADDHTKEEAY